MKIEKVVVWGHKLHSHTHSYIHNGFFRAFEYMGYPTFWFDDSDNVESFDFANTLFITEHQVNLRIPLRDDCIYLTHYISKNTFPGVPKENIIILKVSQRDFHEKDKDWGRGYKYTELLYGNPYEYHANCDGYNCIYLYWATDLLPHEIDVNIRNLHTTDKKREINFVGLMTEPWYKLQYLCNVNGIPFRHYGATFNASDERNKSVDENQRLIRESLISPALQDDYQISVNYIPCRIFKNISYGKMGLTNNRFVYDLFEEKIIYDSDINALCKKGFDFENKPDKNNRVIEVMEIVKKNHTYLNRANTIREFIKTYTAFSMDPLP
jgi:hypothetical protein